MNEGEAEAATYILVTTMETLSLPDDVTALITPRSTLYRSGVSLFTGNVAPGYNGVLTFGMLNNGQAHFDIISAARFAHIMFYQVTDAVNEYKGQWQGGRVSQPDLEVQI